MFTLFDQNRAAGIYVSPGEKKCVALAAEDLAKDLVRAGSREKPEVYQDFPGTVQGNIVIGTASSPDFAKWLEEEQITLPAFTGTWEHYVILVTGGPDPDRGSAAQEKPALIIAGSDERGTMFGIYEISAKFLHIDPTYIFTGILPGKRESAALEEGMSLEDGPHGFPFRGWFINDEDLLEGFSRKRPVGPGYDFHKDYQKVLPMIVETALRLRQNLLIPCSELDIMDPDQEALIPLVTERGMFISMHHQTPCGLNQTMLDHIWQEQVPAGELNYCDRPELYRQSWEQYIRKWAQYDNVIWQLGLRGRGDHPVWYHATNAPETDEDRGALISQAARDQYDIIRRCLHGRKFLSSSTLWMEGMELYQKGTLTFSEDTMVIFADFGPEQMLQSFYYHAPRRNNTKYGIYYHVAFWGCGPHLVEGTSPWKIAYSYQQIFRHGDSTYSVLNVSNVREHVMGLTAVAEVTWQGGTWNPDAFLERWCRDHYGSSGGKAVALYHKWFGAFYVMDSSEIPDQMLLMDGMCRRVGYKLMEIISRKEFTPIEIQNRKLFAFSSTDAFVNHYLAAVQGAIPAFEELLTMEVRLQQECMGCERAYLDNGLILHTQTMLSLYRWVYGLAAAARNRRDSDSDEEFNRLVTSAAAAAAEILEVREKAEEGSLVHWYDGDRLMNIPGIVSNTMDLRTDRSGGIGSVDAMIS